MTRPAGAWARLVLAGLVLLMVVAAPALAAAPKFPARTGRVVDDAHILPAATVADLTAKLQALETKTSRQLVIVTVPSLQGYGIEDYGYQLGRAWEVGQKGINNGALLIVAPNERKVRIEVGYGLEGVVTDALASVILQTQVLPKFRDGDMPAGVVAGANALVEQLSLDPSTAEQRVAAAAAAQADTGGTGDGSPVILFVFILVFFFFIQGILSRRRGGSWLAPLILGSGWGSRDRWGGGGGGGGGWSGGGGGGFSGGGGSFGGGGSSGSW
jgi:uncharacterized protein